MYVKCTHCGYDNSPEYRFCGMCGASLARPPATQASPVQETHRSANGGNGKAEEVHGPSFLGLSEDPKVEFHYLYEDEQPRGRVGLLVFILILLAAGGFLAWQWRNNGFPFNRLSTTANNSGAQTSASPSEGAPAQNQDQQPQTNKPMTGVGDVLPTEPAAQNQIPGKPTESDIPPANGQPNQAEQQNQSTPNQAQQNQAAQNQATPAANTNASAEQNSASEDTSGKPEKAEEAKSTPPPGISEASRVAKEKRNTTPKPAPSRPAEVATPGSEYASMELMGEKYLYGNGAPQNCARAQTSLQTAATHGNSKAQTVLGTMYATGHCVGRDLPTAYRWFARALHQEPQNSRISQDLQVLWRQMTPQEKQLAMAGSH